MADGSGQPRGHHVLNNGNEARLKVCYILDLDIYVSFIFTSDNSIL